MKLNAEYIKLILDFKSAKQRFNDIYICEYVDELIEFEEVLFLRQIPFMVYGIKILHPSRKGNLSIWTDKKCFTSFKENFQDEINHFKEIGYEIK